MYHPTAGFLPSSRLQFPSYLPAMRPTSSDSPAQLVSPLVTPNSSFETLRNFSPPLPAPPSNQYAQYMPMQHVELLQQMWGAAQPATSTPPILMSQQDTGTILRDSTAPVVNAGMTAKKGGHKCKTPVEDMGGQTNTQKQSNKKRKTNAGAAAQPPEAAAVCGVGPVSNPAPATAPPADGVPLHGNANKGRSHHPQESRAVATDVWYFLWALNDKERPDKMPENQPQLTAKPNCKYVACCLCGDDEKNP
ncbi:hypothetical protein EDB19DRAFT_1913262 [Suillus lakei]|nr:hypothetical protein EDB19DRAFT_1913262 [Suillus lakei]